MNIAVIVHEFVHHLCKYLAPLHATTLHQFMEELFDARILMYYSIVQEHTRKWPHFLQESCITLCKNLALLYARFMHCFMQDSYTTYARILI